MNSSRYFLIECIHFCVCEASFLFHKLIWFLIMNFENYKMFYWIKVGPLIQYVFQLMQSNVVSCELAFLLH